MPLEVDAAVRGVGHAPAFNRIVSPPEAVILNEGIETVQQLEQALAVGESGPGLQISNTA
jgi:hypothetical protein